MAPTPPIRMFDTMERGGIRTQLARRDAIDDSGWIEFSIDGHHDHLGRAVFGVNLSGSRQVQLGPGRQSMPFSLPADCAAA